MFFGWHFSQKGNTYQQKKLNIFIHCLTMIPRPKRFPPQSSSEATAHIALRIHVRLRLQELLNHGIVAFARCQMQQCVALGPAARGQAASRTQRNEGRRTLRNFGHLKLEVLEIVATQNHPWTWGTLRSWDVLRTSSWFLKDVAFNVLSKPCQAIKMYLDKLEHTPTLANKSTHDWDTTSFENDPCFCFFAHGISCNWPNMAELA